MECEGDVSVVELVDEELGDDKVDGYEEGAETLHITCYFSDVVDCLLEDGLEECAFFLSFFWF